MPDPLLSEFDADHKFGRFLRAFPLLRFLLESRTEVRGFRVAWTFFWLALAASSLSVLCNAGLLQVTLTNLQTPPKQAPYVLPFGYLHEMNAAFFYLFLAPTFVFLGVRFVRNAQSALKGLSVRKRLISNSKYQKVSLLHKDPLVTLSRMNRRIFRPEFLLLIVVATAVIVIGTEFLPPKLFPPKRGDYWGLAFGYIQAEALPNYKTKTLQTLNDEGREVKQIPAIPAEENWKQNWKITDSQGGPTTPRERFLFWPFIVFAITVQVLFVPFAIWIFFKALFLLSCIYRATSPNEKSPLELKLDYEDPDEAFGLKDIHQAYTYLVAIIFVGAAAMATVVIANVPKGSHRALSGEGSVSIFASVGQGVTTFIPLVLFIALIIFLCFLRMKTEEAREQFVSTIDNQIASSRKPNAQLDEKRKLACKQSAWPDAIFKSWLGGALPSYVVPVVFLSKYPNLAEQIYWVWVKAASLFAWVLEPLHRLIK